MAAPTSWGVGGWGLRSGPGSRRREPDPIVYQSRFKLIYRKLVYAISEDAALNKQIINKANVIRKAEVASAFLAQRSGCHVLLQGRAASDLMRDWRSTGQLFHAVSDNRS